MIINSIVELHGKTYMVKSENPLMGYRYVNGLKGCFFHGEMIDLIGAKEITLSVFRNKYKVFDLSEFEDEFEESENDEKLTKPKIMEMLKEKNIQFDRADKKEVLLKLLEGDSNE